MSVIKFIKTNSMGGTLEPNAFYFVENGTFAESYLTDSDGVAKAIGNSAMIASVINNIVIPSYSTLTTSEALSAGDYVNIHDSGGAKVRKASCTDPTKEAHGFVTASASSGGNVVVQFSGINSLVTGQVPGNVYLGSAGAGIDTSPTASGNIVQHIGVAISSTAVVFSPKFTIELS